MIDIPDKAAEPARPALVAEPGEVARSSSEFRKKPVVITAHRIGNDGWPDAIWQGVMDNAIILHLSTENKQVVGYVEIPTLEGVMRGEVGDWIIRGVKGEFYPCKPDIFAATYEPAAAPARQEGALREALEALQGFNLKPNMVVGAQADFLTLRVPVAAIQKAAAAVAKLDAALAQSAAPVQQAAPSGEGE